MNNFNFFLFLLSVQASHPMLKFGKFAMIRIVSLKKWVEHLSLKATWLEFDASLLTLIQAGEYLKLSSSQEDCYKIFKRTLVWLYSYNTVSSMNKFTSEKFL